MSLFARFCAFLVMFFLLCLTDMFNKLSGFFTFKVIDIYGPEDWRSEGTSEPIQVLIGHYKTQWATNLDGGFLLGSVVALVYKIGKIVWEFISAKNQKGETPKNVHSEKRTNG